MKNKINEIAKEYGVKITEITHGGYGKNGGAFCGDEITILPCDEEYMYELSFWHELGHILLCRSMDKRTHYLSKISMEGAAWEIGLSEASKHNRVWQYETIEMDWARKQLASYINKEYDDLIKYY